MSRARSKIWPHLLTLLHPMKYRMGKVGTQFVPRLFNPEQNWYLRPGLTVHKFFEKLRELRVTYAVLGGVEGLPRFRLDEELEILIADEHVPDLKLLLSDWPVGVLCNFYSVTGVSGSTYRFKRASEKTGRCNWPGDMAVFPPYLAARILDRAVLWDASFIAPALEDQFLSLAYRATYLECGQSGLPSESNSEPCAAEQGTDTCESDFFALATTLGIDLPRRLTREALDEVLARYGWRPPRDTLERLSICQPWIASKFFASAPGDNPGVAVFFIRERAEEAGLIQRIADLIERSGFEILSAMKLEGDWKEKVTRAVRGSNWGRGDFATSGGRPSYVFVALDLIPRSVQGAQCQQYPVLDNARLLYTKQCVRAYCNEGLHPEVRYNAIHSTDNSRDAWHIVSWLFREQEVELRETVRQRRVSFETKEEVLADLTNMGDRAKIELIKWNDRLAVKKTFRNTALRFLRREVDFHENFSSTGRK